MNTRSNKNKHRFKDFNMNLTPHPFTGDIGVLKDEKAINRSVYNLILTNYYERLHDSDKAGHVSGLLFELATPMTAHELKDRIKSVIRNYEPRVELQNVFVNVKDEQNAFAVRIEYFATISTDVVEFEFMLNRVI